MYLYVEEFVNSIKSEEAECFINTFIFYNISYMYNRFDR